jgi:heme/copper-type cytochrome/quinol oxidase subunit 1
MPALPPRDHKRIAVRTALVASIFLFIGFVLVLVLRCRSSALRRGCHII